jgi:Tfp pilus assembly protein PilN
VKHISLLPPEIKAKRIAQQKMSRIYLLLVIAIIVILFINLYLLANAFIIRQDLKALQNEKDFVDNQASVLVEYEELHQQLASTEKLVNDAMGTVPHWGVLLRDISRNLPVGTQLSEIRLNYDDQNGTVLLRGWIGDHNGLADLLDRLDNIEQLDQIQCRVSTETGIEGQEAVQFLVDGVLLSDSLFLAEDKGGE